MKLLGQFLTLVCILEFPAAKAIEAPPVSMTSDFVSEEFRLAYPKKDHLKGLQLYELGYPAKAIGNIIGQLVLLDVVVVTERDVPLVEVMIPQELAGGSKPPRYAIQAHLISATTQASSLKKGQRLRIEGIIVAEGYGVYTIFFAGGKQIK
jgi:hypothetical protein